MNKLKSKSSSTAELIQRGFSPKNDKVDILLINPPSSISDRYGKKDKDIETMSKKSDDPRCLVNSISQRIPRNKKCPVTNRKFKQCCGKL